MEPISESEFVSANSQETNRRQAGDVSPVSLPYRGRDRDNRRAKRMEKSETMKPTQEAPIANVWSVNLQAVPLALVADGEQRVTLELASQPDAGGNVRLLVRRVADGAASQTQPTTKPISRAAGARMFAAMRQATQ